MMHDNQNTASGRSKDTCRDGARSAQGWAGTVLISITALIAHHAQAQADRPATAPSLPLLVQLNRETRTLYKGIEGGVLRVQMPPATWSDDQAARVVALNKYNLDPAVRKQLLDQRGVVAPVDGAASKSGSPPAKAAAPAGAQNAAPRAGVLIVVPPVGAAPAYAAKTDLPEDVFRPNNIGLVLDDKGHVLVPMYMERDASPDQGIPVAGPDGAVMRARFIGSDAQTNLTVVQLPTPAGKPVRLAREKPDEGTLVLYLSSLDASGRLGIWNTGTRDHGVVIGIDGQVLGIASNGQMLAGSACRVIADQIIKYGAVKRATLGVIITQIQRNDPIRGALPVLSERSAVRIDQVIPGSAADKGGLRPGDVLLAVAGEATSDIPSVAAAIAARNGPTPLQVLRDDKAIEIIVDLLQK